MRLFLAAWPPPDVLAALAALPRPDEPGLRWTTVDQWHVTLRFFGEVDESAPVVDALAGAALPAATATLGPAIVRIGRDIAAFPVGGLERLARAVTAATRTFGAAPPHRRFRGHLTIARSKRGRLELARPLRMEAAWPVDELALVRSQLHPTGARYDTLETFPTTPSAPPA